MAELPTIVVEQLNRAQWHVLLPNGSGSGVGDWVSLVSYALLVGMLDSVAVESVDLDGNRLLLARGLPLLVQGGRS